MIPTPYLLLAIVIALAVVGIGGELDGRKRGVDAQKVADQGQFDAVNAALTKQKAEANAALQSVLEHNLDLMTERDTLKTNLENAHETSRRNTDNLRTELAGVRLAFQSAGSGGGGSGTQSAGAGPASNPAAAVCVVSDETASALRAIAYDADTLRDDYKLLYDWAHSLK